MNRLMVVVVSLAVLTGFNWLRDDRSPAEERRDVLEMRTEVLEMLYQEAPGSKSRIQESVGYAVFSNVGINLLLLSTANGYGVAKNNLSGEEIYMKMYSAGVGLGYGVKDFRAVFVFETREAFDAFIEQGWQATAQTDAAMVAGDKGDAVNYEIELAPGVKLYQITENGLALQATLQGTRYVVDDRLN
jgi:lipid-binding SYLF domain-containing protein